MLPQFSEHLSQRANEQLEVLGVEVQTGARVQAISRGRVQLEHGEILAQNIIWAAGVAASPITRKLGVPLDRAGRIQVQPDLSLPGHPEVFALGDLALVLDEHGQPVPGIAPAAMQMAGYAARVIETELNSSRRPTHPFVYWDKGTMATIGRSAGVARIKGVEISGLFAWLGWLGIHLIFLIGFRNKVSVMLNWIHSYFTYRRGSRIITGLAEPRPSRACRDSASPHAQ